MLMSRNFYFKITFLDFLLMNNPTKFVMALLTIFHGKLATPTNNIIYSNEPCFVMSNER